ncbi:hypothetical protein [Kosakonia sp. 1610]|uniref:hypothetical protein n=1 Tax=Kosakonia sp. 1610 TaxID=3156426 RepID=UPI003D223812
MSDVNERLSKLEDHVDEITLELHAAHVAITVLSSVIGAIVKEPGAIARGYEQGIKSAEAPKFRYPAPAGYKQKLDEIVLKLLAKVD